jgi:hypothetical protein
MSSPRFRRSNLMPPNLWSAGLFVILLALGGWGLLHAWDDQVGDTSPVGQRPGDSPPALLTSDLTPSGSEEPVRLPTPSAGGALVRADRVTPPSDTSLMLRVQDEAGVGLPGASLFERSSSGACAPLGETGREGELEVQLDSDLPERLVACKSGYVQVDWELPPDLPEGYIFVLERGMTLEGTVVRPDGLALDEGTSVVALPVSRIPSLSGIDSLHEPRVDVASAEVGPDGEFTLAGLEPGASYELAAGSTGWVTTERTIAQSGDTGVRLEVYATYGVRMRLRSEDGAPIETSRSLHYTDYFGTNFLDPQALVPMQRSVELSLAGLDPAELDAGPHESVFFLAGPRDLPRLLSMGVHVNVPGYERAEEAVQVPRCLGGIERHDILLRRSAKAWTTLTVEVEGGPWEERRRTGTFQPEMFLRFLDSTGQWGKLSFSPGVSEHRVPAGEYELELRLEVSGWRPESRSSFSAHLTGPEDTLTVPYPDGLGGLELEVLDRDGWAAHGPVMLFYRAPDGQSLTRCLAFQSEPYRVGAFPSGEWQVFVLAGYGRVMKGVLPSQYTPIVVRDREVTKARLQSL